MNISITNVSITCRNLNLIGIQNVICIRINFVTNKEIVNLHLFQHFTRFHAFYVNCTLEMEDERAKKILHQGGNDDETYLHFNKQSYHIENEGRKVK